MWIGSDNAIYTKEGDKWDKVELRGDFIDLGVDSNNTIWAGVNGFSSEAGVYKITNSDTIRYTEDDGLISYRVQALEVDYKGDVWIGTYSGLSVFDGVSFTNR